VNADLLQPELDELYEAFAGVRKPQLRSNDPWRPDVEWIARQPLRELPAATINEFVFELGSSIGDEDDVRYLIPRLCELYVLHEIQSLVDYPIGLGLQLTNARWQTWSAREREAIRAFFDSALQWSISHLRAATIVDLVTTVAILFDDLSPWLARIGARDDLPGVCAVLWLADWLAPYCLKARPRRPPSLKKRRAQVEQIQRWLGDATHLARVESLRDRSDLTGPDGEDLTFLFATATSWLHVYGSVDRPPKGGG
jgi:hypothetical protein